MFRAYIFLYGFVFKQNKYIQFCQAMANVKCLLDLILFGWVDTHLKLPGEGADV